MKLIVHVEGREPFVFMCPDRTEIDCVRDMIQREVGKDKKIKVEFT